MKRRRQLFQRHKKRKPKQRPRLKTLKQSLKVELISKLKATMMKKQKQEVVLRVKKERKAKDLPEMP